MKRTKIQRGRSLEGAFSLIEILVAVTLLSVITIGLLAMFYQTQKAFRLGTSQVDVLEGGRGTMQLICRDLQQMHTSNMDDMTNFLAESTGEPWIVMGLPGGGQRQNRLQDVSFLTREGGTWNAISYRVHHRDRGGGTLYRAVLSVDMEGILTDANLKPRHQWIAVSNIFGRVCERFTGTYSVTNPTPEVAMTPALPPLVFDRIADGVVHFRVLAYTESGILYTNNSLVRVNGYGMRNFVPAYLDVELAILDPKGVEQFNRRGDAAARAYLETQAYRTQIFRQRINLRARQLEHELFATAK